MNANPHNPPATAPEEEAAAQAKAIEVDEWLAKDERAYLGLERILRQLYEREMRDESDTRR